MKFIVLILSIIFITNIFGKNLGTKSTPINIALVPGQDVKKLMTNGRVMEEFLQKETGLFFKVVIPQNFIAVVESLGTERVDIGVMNSFGYILANEKYGAQAKLMGLFKNRSEYWGQIIARNDGPKTFEDLNGKTFAFVDPASTSGFLMAKKALNDHNIKLKNHLFAGKHDSVVSMVYQGRVDAGATYHTLPVNGVPQDARTLVKTQYPDVFEKIKILKITGPIPNDPIVFRKGFPLDLEQKIIDALLKFTKTTEGSEAFLNLYHIDDLKRAKDSDWDPLRKILKEIEMSANDFIKK